MEPTGNDPSKKYHNIWDKKNEPEQISDEEKEALQKEKLEKGAADDKALNQFIKETGIKDSGGKKARLRSGKHLKNPSAVRDTLNKLSQIPEEFEGAKPQVEIPHLEDCAIVPIKNGEDGTKDRYVVSGGADLFKFLKLRTKEGFERRGKLTSHVADFLNLFLITCGKSLQFGGNIRDEKTFPMDNFVTSQIAPDYSELDDADKVYARMCQYLQELIKKNPNGFDESAIEEAGHLYRRKRLGKGSILLPLKTKYKEGEFLKPLVPVNEIPPEIANVLAILQPRFRYVGEGYNEVRNEKEHIFEIVYKQKNMNDALQYGYGHAIDSTMRYFKFHSIFDIYKEPRPAKPEEEPLMDKAS